MKLLAPFATLFTLVSLLLLCCCYHHLIIFVTAYTELSSSLLPHTSSSSSPSYYSMLVNLSLSSLLRMKYDPSAPITFLPSSQKSFSSILLPATTVPWHLLNSGSYRCENLRQRLSLNSSVCYWHEDAQSSIFARLSALSLSLFCSSLPSALFLAFYALTCLCNVVGCRECGVCWTFLETKLVFNSTLKC